MRPLDFAAIRHDLENAIKDIDYFLENEWEQNREAAGRLYELMEAGRTLPKAEEERMHQLTEAEYNALLFWNSVDGNPISNEEREAILANIDPGESLSGTGQKSWEFWARGGWRESSRRAADWLRKAGETVAADVIDVALGELPGRPRHEGEISIYHDAVRLAAGNVKRILDTCLKSQSFEPENEGQSGEEYIAHNGHKYFYKYRLSADLSRREKKKWQFLDGTWCTGANAENAYSMHHGNLKKRLNEAAVAEKIERKWTLIDGKPTNIFRREDVEKIDGILAERLDRRQT